MGTSFRWILVVSLIVTILIYMTLSQIKKIAEDNVPTAAEHAQCLAERDPASADAIEEDCPTKPDVLFAARHPIRNTAIVGVLSIVLGYLYLLFHRSSRGSSFFGSSVPDAPPAPGSKPRPPNAGP